MVLLISPRRIADLVRVGKDSFLAKGMHFGKSQYKPAAYHSGWE